jgi:hypothetical protein
VELKPDPWKRAFRYACEDGHVTLLSLGPDGIADSPDDIRAGEYAPANPGDTGEVERIYSVEIYRGKP